MALAAFATGADGWYSAVPNLIPELNPGLYDTIQNNDLVSDQILFLKQLNLLRFNVAKGLPRASGWANDS